MASVDKPRNSSYTISKRQLGFYFCFRFNVTKVMWKFFSFFFTSTKTTQTAVSDASSINIHLRDIYSPHNVKTCTTCLVTSFKYLHTHTVTFYVCLLWSLDLVFVTWLFFKDYCSPSVSGLLVYVRVIVGCFLCFGSGFILDLSCQNHL